MGWNRLLARSWLEPDFRNEVLRADEDKLRELYRELGYDVPAGVDLVVREVDDARLAWRSSENRIELLLPPPPASEILRIALGDPGAEDPRHPPFCWC